MARRKAETGCSEAGSQPPPRLPSAPELSRGLVQRQVAGPTSSQVPWEHEGLSPPRHPGVKRRDREAPETRSLRSPHPCLAPWLSSTVSTRFQRTSQGLSPESLVLLQGLARKHPGPDPRTPPISLRLGELVESVCLCVTVPASPSQCEGGLTSGRGPARPPGSRRRERGRRPGREPAAPSRRGLGALPGSRARAGVRGAPAPRPRAPARRPAPFPERRSGLQPRGTAASAHPGRAHLGSSLFLKSRKYIPPGGRGQAWARGAGDPAAPASARRDPGAALIPRLCAAH